MSQSQILWLFYAAVMVVRVLATSRRLRLPKIRGEEYFFNIHVGPAFYSGPGRAVLAAYRRWMLLPFLIDLVAVPLIVASGSTRYLVHLMLGSMVAGLLIYVKGATRTAREARRHEIDSSPPVAQVALSLTPRHARDYTNWSMEAIIGVITIGCLAAAARAYLRDPEPGPLLDFFRIPILIVYLQLGALLMKLAIVAWRTPAPSDDAEAYLAWRESLRRRYLFICDAVRLVWTVMLLVPTIAFTLDLPWEAWGDRSMQTALAIATLIVLGAWCVWYNRYTKGVVAAALARKPVTFPEVLDAAEPRPGAVCYRPGTPLTFIRTERGVALNLASRRTQIAGLYLCGLIVLIRL